jgi:hypothetical protein
MGNKSCVDKFIVDSWTDEVAMENELLKQEMDYHTKALVALKGKKTCRSLMREQPSLLLVLQGRQGAI